MTAHHNCCRVCDPFCWVSNSGAEVATSQNYTPPPDPMPTMPGEPSTTHRGQQVRAESPLPPRVHPPHIVPWPMSLPAWRPLPFPARPTIRPRPRWLEQNAIKDDILRIQNEVPAGAWDYLVKNLTRAELKELSRSGACLIPNSPMGRESIILSDGGTDIQGV